MDAKRARIEHFVGEQVGRPVSLTFTDNVKSMASFRRDRLGGVVLRLHRMFANAPDAVLHELARWVRQPGRQPPGVRRFVRSRRQEIRPALSARRTPRLRAEGRHHDLRPIYADVNARYFDSRHEMKLTWSRRPARRRVRSMRLGTYCHETGVITVSRRLDRADVPRYFVAYVIYHELLHAELGVERTGSGRRRVHGPEFQRRERLFSDYDRARAFEAAFSG